MATPNTNAAEQLKDEKRFSCLYLGYASNLSPRTMKQRCPDSLYVGLARLDDWKWIINSTGYANIVPSPGDVVYGTLAFLSARDESALDDSEGVPWLYEKKYLEVTRFEKGAEDLGQTVEAMTYVDVDPGRGMEEGRIEKEYIVYCNKAIKEGVELGLPDEFFEKYYKPFVPEQDPTQPDIAMIRTTKQNFPAPARLARFKGVQGAT